MTSRVLVVGIDGVRFDALARVETPNIRRVAAGGFLTPVTVHPAGPTISGPTWATIATGTLADKHGVADNDHPSAALPTDFLTVARAAGRQTLTAASWPAILSTDGCGPLFQPGGTLVAPPDPGHDPAAWDEADEYVVAGAARALAGGGVEAAFVYLGIADETAHAAGVEPRYDAAIARCDERLGRLLGAVGFGPDDTHDEPAGAARTAAAGSRPAEPWTVIVVTDHGHVDAGGHGGDSTEERTAWLAAAGPGIPAAAPAGLQQADVFAQVLASLGLSADPDRFAVPFGGR